jgi:hypothetical protein
VRVEDRKESKKLVLRLLKIGSEIQNEAVVEWMVRGWRDKEVK